ncbi:MAG: GGDEF domain-containing protein [Pseudomonadota bacterium]
MTQQTVDTLRFNTLKVFVVISITVSPPLLILYHQIGIPELVVALSGYFICSGVIFWRIKDAVSGHIIYSRIFLALTILLILYSHYLGSEEIDNKPWAVMIPILVLSLTGLREGLVWILGVIVTLVMIYSISPNSYNLFSISIQLAAMGTTTYVFYIFMKHYEKNLIKLSLLSQIDELTGTYNRRHFNKTYDAEFRRLTRNHGALSILMIDIDHFKEYNDMYGHQQGDDVLMAVAATLTKSARRAADSVYRYGGEEFCILLPEIDEESTSLFAQDLCQDVRELQISHQGVPLGQLSISVGYNHCQNAQRCTVKDLLKGADNALYAAKNKGRDQAVGAEELN